MPVFPTNPLLSKLVYQLAPAALVSAVGIVLLSSLAKPVSAPPQGTPTTVAVQTEAVFTPTPRPVVPEQASAAAAPTAPKSKPQPRKVAAVEVPTPRPAPVAAPLPIAPPIVAEQTVAAPATDRTVMDRVRGVTATVGSLPHAAYSKVASWFSADEPPRPPGEIPTQNFSKVAM